MLNQYVLSHYQTRPLEKAYAAQQTKALASLDLGISSQEVSLAADGVWLPNGQSVSWSSLADISQSENSCFEIVSGQSHKITRFSEETQRAYSLFPTQTAPTMLVSGITMHRIINCDPWQDTKNKIKAFGGTITGNVLDTTMGLGYTAILAAETAAQVTTVELDPAVVEICRANPWSKRLFTDDRITRYVGHVWDVIEDELSDANFSHIIHDPPMFNMAGDLYSSEFYDELYKRLTSHGRLFHYIGNPKSKSGSTVTRGVVKRLKEVGFRRVSPRPQAFGVLAIK